jgi:hypothetical protein
MPRYEAESFNYRNINERFNYRGIDERTIEKAPLILLSSVVIARALMRTRIYDQSQLFGNTVKVAGHILTFYMFVTLLSEMISDIIYYAIDTNSIGLLGFALFTMIGWTIGSVLAEYIEVPSPFGGDSYKFEDGRNILRVLFAILGGMTGILVTAITGGRFLGKFVVFLLYLVRYNLYATALLYFATEMLEISGNNPPSDSVFDIRSHRDFEKHQNDKDGCEVMWPGRDRQAFPVIATYSQLDVRENAIGKFMFLLQSYFRYEHKIGPCIGNRLFRIVVYPILGKLPDMVYQAILVESTDKAEEVYIPQGVSVGASEYIWGSKLMCNNSAYEASLQNLKKNEGMIDDAILPDYEYNLPLRACILRAVNMVGVSKFRDGCGKDFHVNGDEGIYKCVDDIGENTVFDAELDTCLAEKRVDYSAFFDLKKMYANKDILETLGWDVGLLAKWYDTDNDMVVNDAALAAMIGLKSTFNGVVYKGDIGRWYSVLSLSHLVSNYPCGNFGKGGAVDTACCTPFGSAYTGERLFTNARTDKFIYPLE